MKKLFLTLLLLVVLFCWATVSANAETAQLRLFNGSWGGILKFRSGDNTAVPAELKIYSEEGWEGLQITYTAYTVPIYSEKSYGIRQADGSVKMELKGGAIISLQLIGKNLLKVGWNYFGDIPYSGTFSRQ